MVRKTSLSEAIQQSAGNPVQEPAPKANPQESNTAQHIPPSRQGKKTIAGHFDPAVSRQLHQLALDEDSNIQHLLKEALNLLFTDRGKPTIA